MIKRKTALIPACVVIATISACHMYRGEAIEGWVVDGETKKPIKGATVVVVWETKGGLHYHAVGQLFAQEIVTDDGGHFMFGAWGPKLVLGSELGSGEPGLIVFHSDYNFWLSGNSDLKPPQKVTLETRKSDWAGKTISLERSVRHSDEYAQNAHIAELNLHLNSYESGFSCIWQRMPRLTAELVRRQKEISARKIHNSLPTEETLFRAGKCDDPKVVLEAFR